MQQGSICVSIGEKTFSDIFTALEKLDFAEIRLDCSELNDGEIYTIFANKKPLIATCREGFYNREQRLKILLKAIAAGAAYVDVETEADDDFRQTLAQQAKSTNCKLIVSYHNFDETPSTEELIKIVKTCEAQGADFIKLVTTANTISDSARVLSLYDLFADKNLIAFAMGDKGLISRVACVFLGAPYTYASLSDEKPLAKGQISYAKMKSLLTDINNANNINL